MSETIETHIVLKQAGSYTQSFSVPPGTHTMTFDLEILESQAIKKALALLIKDGESFKDPRVGAEIAAYLLGYLEIEPMDIIKEVGVDLTREALERSNHYKSLKDSQEKHAL